MRMNAKMNGEVNGKMSEELSKIREAQPSDREAWLRMRLELWPSDVDEHAIEIDRYFEGNGRFIDQVFVCLSGTETPIGFVELRIRNYAEGSEQTAVPYVEGWYVDETSRTKGVGALLIARAEGWALELGYAELASDADIGNQTSIDAHLKLGFQEIERAVCFLKKL